MKKFAASLALAIVAASLVPSAAFAQTDNSTGVSNPSSTVAPVQDAQAAPATPGSGLTSAANTTGNTTGGLVPCQGAADCNICTFGSLLQNIINFAIGLSIPLAAVLFAYAGWLYFSNRENTSQIERAHKIFSSVLIGFAIAVAGWLIVQTILKTLAPGYQSWTTFTCTGTRNMNATIGQLFQQSGVGQVTTAPPISVGGSAYVCQSGTVGSDGYCYNNGQLTGAPTLQTTPNNSGLACPDGTAIAGGDCYSPEGIDMGPAAPAAPGQVGVGDCSPGALTDDFAEDSATMSCIAQKESGCSTISQGDKISDGNYASIGTYQINMSANPVQCDGYNNGQTVPCPQAFNVPVTGTTMRNGTAVVVNQSLYSQCKTMLMDPSCNAQVAQGVLNSQGFTAWSTYNSCQ